MGLDRRITLTYRYAYRDRPKDPLTLQKHPRHMWGLTESGAQAAKRLNGPRKAEKGRANTTARFLEKRLRETGGINGNLWSAIRGALRSRLPASATSGMVEDHIQNCWAKLIRLDSFQKRLAEGENITDSHIITYAMRTAFTDLRDMGTEPVCREMYGARTEQERKKGVHKIPPSKDARVSWQKDEDDDTGTWKDIADEAHLEDQVLFEELRLSVEAAIRTKKSRADDRYIKIVGNLLDGYTVKEIAQMEGVSPYRAAGIIAEARRCLREAAQEGLLGDGYSCSSS